MMDCLLMNTHSLKSKRATKMASRRGLEPLLLP